MKIISFYLPQFHEFEENNNWWGKGFTEWTNVKKGHPLFKDHYQPHVPLDHNYYDLVNDESVLYNQIELAKKYGIDGFCFYHYWFENGKKLMEKPIERFLKDKSLDIPFMLCWANENWTRRWDGKESDVLIKQDYDDDNGWIDHYNYLKNFFADDRYIKDKIGRPIIIIYKPQLIPKLKTRIALWNDKSLQDGFPGLCFVCQFPQKDEEIINCFDYAIDFEPIETVMQWELVPNRLLIHPCLLKDYFICALKKKLGFRSYNKFSYKSIALSSVNRRYESKVWRGVFPGWDNTARRGNNADVIHGSSPKLFRWYLSEQIKKSKVYGGQEPFLFINAWNEWGEGAHLEPDERYRFEYLEMVYDVINNTFIESKTI